MTVPIFDIYTDDMKNQLDALNASGLDAIDFDKYNDVCVLLLYILSRFIIVGSMALSVLPICGSKTKFNAFKTGILVL